MYTPRTKETQGGTVTDPAAPYSEGSVSKVVGKITAYVLDGYKERIKTVYVPVLFDEGEGIPQLPTVIQIGDHIGLLHETSPVSYKDCGVAYQSEEV